MANVRIKDITTTASAPAADDYLAIDGATAGTRKISAANLGGDTLTVDIKEALLQIASKVAYIDGQGQTYYDDLYDALYPPAPPATLLSISAVYTQSGTVYDTDTLDSLKPDLVVTASYDDGTTQTVTTYTLSGTLAVGTSTITVTYGGKTATFNVEVVSSWDNYNYTLENGQIKKLVGSTGVYTQAPAGNITFDSTNTTRRSFLTEKVGEKPVVSKPDGYNDSIYYPIPIPADATQVTISITPNTQFHGEAFYTLSNGEYTRVSDPGWKQGAFTHTFTAGQYQYLTTTSKYNSAGSSYPEEPTVFSVVFE